MFGFAAHEYHLLPKAFVLIKFKANLTIMNNIECLLQTFESPLDFNFAILLIAARISLQVARKHSESSSDNLSTASFSS